MTQDKKQTSSVKNVRSKRTSEKSETKQVSKIKIQKRIVEARSSWGAFSEEDQMLLLCGVTAELGELATALRAEYIYKKPHIPDEDKSSLKHEMADVAIFLYALADKCGIDLDEAVQSKIAINDKRFKK